MKTAAKQRFLLLLLLLATSNSLQSPDFIEEDGMFGSTYMKYNTKKAAGGDDEMSDDTSLSADEDKEMMETADTSQHDEDEGMGEEGEDTKTVEKSKIQHNSSKSNAENNSEDEMDNQEDENAENEDKKENLTQGKDESNDGGKDNDKESTPSKKEEVKGNKDIKSSLNKDSKDQVEKPNQGGTKSQTKDLPEAKKMLSNDDKGKEVTPSKTDIAKNVESTSSEKTNVKDKDNEDSEGNESAIEAESKSNDSIKKAELGTKTDDNTDKGTNDKPKITRENTDNKDSETPTTTHDHNNDVGELKPAKSNSKGLIKESENAKPTTNEDSANEGTEQLKPTAEDNYGNGDNTRQELKIKDNNNNNNNDDNNNENNNNNSSNNDDGNDNNDTNKEETETVNNDENTDTDKPKLTTDDKAVNGRTEEQKSTTETDNNNEDVQKPKIENNTENKDTDKPGLTTKDKSRNKDDEDSKLTPIDKTENEDTNKPEQITNDNTDNKTTEKPQLKTNDNTDNERTKKPTATTKSENINDEDTNKPQQTTSDSYANEDTDKIEAKTNEINDKNRNFEDKQNTGSSTVTGSDLADNKQTMDKPKSDLNSNRDNDSPNTAKASDVSSDFKDKTENEQAKDNEESSPVNFDHSDSKLKENNGDKDEGTLPKTDNLTKDVQNLHDKDRKEDEPDSNGDKDIQTKVEQLSMNTGDESEEEGRKRAPTAAKTSSADATKVTSSSGNDGTAKESSKISDKPEGDNGMAYQEDKDKSEQVQGDTLADKADVVNTLVESVAGNENASGTSVSEVGAQTSGDNAQEEDKTTQDKKGNVKGLLNDLVPSGILPNLPKGFAKLSEMNTVSFTYNVHENNDVTVTSDIKEPMKLFDGKLEISNGNLEFSYNDKEKKGQKWQFKAQGTWVNGDQEIDIILESSKHEDHFTLTGKGDSLALHDYSSMFAEQETFSKSDINMHVFEEIMLSNIELYVVFEDFENIVSFVSGDVRIDRGTKASRCQTFIEKFPKKEPVFSILLDFVEGSPQSVLASVMADKIAEIPYVKELLDDKGLLKVTNGGFGFAASSADVKKLKLNVFGEGMLERDLGSHISSGITLTLPISFHSQNNIENHDIIMKISHDDISFFPTKNAALDLTKVFKTLSEFTRPKISSLGYPDVGNVLLRELRYDLSKSVYTVLGYSTSQFNIAPGMLYLDDATLEFRQHVPDEFATLALYGSGSTNIGQSKFNISLHTDTAASELLIEGQAHTLWSPDIATSFGVTMETDDDVKRILDDNRMFNMNIENIRMFASVKDGRSGLVHFSGYSRPISWNDAIQVEAVVFHDNDVNKRRMTIGYLFDKLPLTYAIDAFSFGQFPTPRLLENSRNSTLVLSPVNTESLFLNPAFNGLSFMRGLSLVGQFRLPDVCSLNTLCESAAQLLGTEKWYRVQGLVSSRGYTLAGYVDKDFNLAKGLKLSDNILEFVLGNYSYMSISTAMRLDKNNLTFSGFVNFDPNGVRLRVSSNDVWKHPFPGDFLTFDRLQIDIPLVSGMAIDELLVTGELNFGLRGSLYRIFAPAYLTFTPSKPKNVGFQATMANVTLETITSALNFKSSLPGVLLNSRFPNTLVARYTPKGKKDENLDLYGKLDILSRTLICKLRIDENKHITATTSHSKFPLILEDGLITVYADQHRPKLGPRVWFTITPESTKFKLDGFANFMGLGTKTEIDVSESGTDFSLSGNLFGVTKTVVSFMSPDSLPENGPYFASACLPDIIPRLTSHVNLLLASAADQAERYMKQASKNYNQATAYHEQALADEHKHILMLDEGENDIEMDDREMFLAEERYNKTCREQQCGKTCIGCTSWLKCCDHDVFGNCVKCPGWKPCCWHGKSPICKGKNHACRIMKQVAAENLQKIARRVYANKEKKRAREKILWKSEFMKGKTQAVLDAARRAVHLVNHDSRVGLGAAASIKRFGLERLVNIKSVCFHTTLKTLATSCVTMRINTTFANKGEMQSLPYYGCLNRELVPKLANHIAHFMFHDKQKDKGVSKGRETKPKPGHRRSGHLFGKPLEDEQVDLTIISPGNTYMRRRREYDPADDDVENRPFWLIRNNYQPHVPSLLQQRTTVPRSPLKKKWQIPESRKGKCKVYRQLVEICKDMMSTVKRMSESYEDGKEKYYKRLTELQLGLNTTIYDLEKQVMDTPELRDRLPDIEMNIRTVGAGVTQWKMNCEADQEDQNKIAIQQWVSTMEGRIRKLGGQGVDRFLSNLFRAFEGMFLGAETPKHSAQKVLNTLQAIREISATFHDIFGNNEITLEKANNRAEIVMSTLKQIKNAQIFCDD